MGKESEIQNAAISAAKAEGRGLAGSAETCTIFVEPVVKVHDAVDGKQGELIHLPVNGILGKVGLIRGPGDARLGVTGSNLRLAIISRGGQIRGVRFSIHE